MLDTNDLAFFNASDVFRSISIRFSFFCRRLGGAPRRLVILTLDVLDALLGASGGQLFIADTRSTYHAAEMLRVQQLWRMQVLHMCAL